MGWNRGAHLPGRDIGGWVCVPTPSAPTPQVLRAGAASSNGSGTPPPPPAGSSAAEAEAWIAAWRAKQGEGSTGTVVKQAQLAGDGNK